VAVFPDRIVLKNSTDAEATIIAAIQGGGTDEIQQGELVVGRGTNYIELYGIDSNGNVQKVGANATLDGLTDVTLTSVANLDYLRYDGSQWVNVSSAPYDIAQDGGDFDTGTADNTTTIFDIFPISVDAHSDVDTTTTAPNVGEVLKWDGTNWVPGVGSGGGATAIDDLTDVDTSTVAPTDGQVLTWDNAAGQWEPADSAGGGSSTLAGLDDTLLGSPADGDFLMYFNNAWRDVTLDISRDTSPMLGGTLDLDGHGLGEYLGNLNIEFSASGSGLVLEGNGADTQGNITLNCELNTHGVKIQSPPHSAGASYTLTLPTGTGSNGQVLTTDGSGSLSWTTGLGGAASMDDLSDADTTTNPPTDGQVLTWDNASGNWVPEDASGGGASALGDLTDVDTTTTPPVAGQALIYKAFSNGIALEYDSDLSTNSGTGSVTLGGTVGTTPTINGVTTKYGAGSLYLPQDGAVWYQSGSDWNIQGTDFTIEMWAYITNPDASSSTFFPLVMRRGASYVDENHWALSYFGNGYTSSTSLRRKLQLVIGMGSSGTNTYSSQFVWPANQWVHVAVAREGSDVRFFVDGALITTATDSTTAYNGTATVVVGGVTDSGAQAKPSDLYVDDFGFDGTAAKYTAPFTPAGILDLAGWVPGDVASGGVTSIIAGSGISVNQATGDVTISATGGSSALDDLTDVTISSATTGEVLRYNGSQWVDAQLAYTDLSGTPSLVTDLDGLSDVTIASAATGEVLRYNGSQWVDAQLAYSDLSNTPILVTDLDGLSDVTITAAATGEVLRYNGSAWVDQQLDYSDLANTPTSLSDFTNDSGFITDITAEALGDLSNVVIPSPTTGDVLSYNGTNWVNSAAPPADISGSSINALNDVDTSTTPPTNGQGLIWNNSTGQWEPGSVSAGPVALDDLTDVTIGTPATGEVLRYDGASWVDAQLAYSDLSGTPSLAPVATSGDYSDLTNKPTIPANIDDLGDVDTSTSAPTTGQVLEWNGTNWIPATPTPGGVTSIIAGTGISVDQATGDVTITATGGGGGATAIDDLTDVDTTTAAPNVGQVLKWDGSNWIPGNDNSGGGGAAELGRGDGGDIDFGTVESAFVFGVYGGGDVDTTTEDKPVEFVSYDVDGGEIT